MTTASTSDTSRQSKRIAVIGGGLTGLAAAHRLAELQGLEGDSDRPVDVTLIESAERLGGVISTRQEGDYLVETGADSFITNKPWGVDLCKRLGLEDDLISTDAHFRRSLVLRKGKPVPTPDGFQLMVPGQLWSIVTSELFSPWGKARLLMECVVRRKNLASDEDESLAAFVRRRFGQEALDRIVQPMVGGIYTSDPEKLSLRATLPRFLEMEAAHGSLIRALRRSRNDETSASGARYGLFVSLKDGMSQLLETLAERVRQTCDVRLGQRVAEVVRNDHSGRYLLVTSDGRHEEFDGVVIATSARAASTFLKNFTPNLADELGEIEYASTAIVCTGHRLSDIAHPMDAFGLVIPHIEGRRILAVSFLSRKFPRRAPVGSIQLRTFVGGAMQPEILLKSDDELISLVRTELGEIFGVTGEPDFATIARYDNGMPQYHVGHLNRVARIESLISETPGVVLAGNSYHGVGIPDCIHSGEQAAEAIHQFTAVPSAE